MAGISRRDSGEIGRFPNRIFHAARRGGSSATIGIMLILGGAGLFLWHVFNLWVLEMAIGKDLPAAMYHVLAGIMVLNVVCFELLRRLVVNRKKVASLVCCGLGCALWPARATYNLATRQVVLRTAVRVVRNVVELLKTMASVTRKTVKRLVLAVLPAAGGVVAFAAVFLKTVLSFMLKRVASTVYAVLCTLRRVVVNAACFLLTKMFRRWRGTRQAVADEHANADEHDVHRPGTIDEPTDAAEVANVLPPKRRRDIGVASEEMKRPSQRMALRSRDGPADTAPPHTKSSPGYQKQEEGKGTVRDGSKKHKRASTPESPSMRAKKCDALASALVRYGKKSRGGSSSPSQAAGPDDMEVDEPTQTPESRTKRELDGIDGPSRRDTRVKREHRTDDNSSFKAALHGGLAPPRGSVCNGSRNRAAKNTGGKGKRCRSTAAAEEKSASRQRFDKAREVHCCKADPEDMVEAWVCAPGFDGVGGEPVPGVFHYLPVTLIQQSGKRERGGKVSWYVQPGGQDMQTEWSEEGGRIVWKVPAESLFQKAPAESGEGCNTCGKKGGGQISWNPHKPEHICDSCADAPRRNLQRHYDARDLGFERARACGCQGW